MAKFRKKPVVVDAMQFTEKNWREVCAFAGLDTYDPPHAKWEDAPTHLEIKTREGTMKAVPGDWIICGVASEFYPCKPDIFEETYEPAGE